MHFRSDWSKGRAALGLDPSASLRAGSRGRPSPHLRGTFARAAITAIVLSLSLTAHAQSRTAPVTKSPARTEDPQLFRNTAFGFRYQIPYGWVERTQAMKEGDEAGKSELLLAVFERPPEAAGDTINSAVVIASESTASYPGLKTAEDYLNPLTELATAKGFKPDGEPYAIEVESRQLVRADFIKALSLKSTSDKLSMRQCTLVLLAKGQIVSFTFIAGSEEEVDDLMDGLHFSAVRSPAR